MQFGSEIDIKKLEQSPEIAMIDQWYGNDIAPGVNRVDRDNSTIVTEWHYQFYCYLTLILFLWGLSWNQDRIINLRHLVRAVFTY